MSILSSHTLDSVSGLSATGVRVEFFRLSGEKGKEKVFAVQTNDEGRISETFDSNGRKITEYELVFHSGEYLTRTKIKVEKPIIDTVVIRIKINSSVQHYHIPVLIAPHCYTVWWSGEPD